MFSGDPQALGLSIGKGQGAQGDETFFCLLIAQFSYSPKAVCQILFRLNFTAHITSNLSLKHSPLPLFPQENPEDPSAAPQPETCPRRRLFQTRATAQVLAILTNTNTNTDHTGNMTSGPRLLWLLTDASVMSLSVQEQPRPCARN